MHFKMIPWRLCLVFTVVFCSKSAMSSCYGSNCSSGSSSGISVFVIIVILIVSIVKCAFWIYCCYRCQQRQSRTVYVYQRLDTGISTCVNTVNVRPRTTQMTPTASQAHGTRPKNNNSTQQGNANPACYDSPPPTLLSLADPDSNSPPPYSEEISA